MASKRGDKVRVEPFRLKLVDFLTADELLYYRIGMNQYYSPDYLINDKWVVEIKPEKMLRMESPFFDRNIVRMLALDRYCKKEGYECSFLTDEIMGELILTNKEIQKIPKSDVLFFKEKHNVKFKMAV